MAVAGRYDVWGTELAATAKAKSARVQELQAHADRARRRQDRLRARLVELTAKGGASFKRREPAR